MHQFKLLLLTNQLTKLPFYTFGIGKEPVLYILYSNSLSQQN